MCQTVQVYHTEKNISSRLPISLHSCRTDAIRFQDGIADKLLSDVKKFVLNFKGCVNGLNLNVVQIQQNLLG